MLAKPETQAEFGFGSFSQILVLRLRHTRTIVARASPFRPIRENHNLYGKLIQLQLSDGRGWT